MMAGLGLGYMAQGILQGRQQNIENSLRRKEEERRQAAEDRAKGLFPFQQRAAAAGATSAEAGAKTDQFNASDSMLGLMYDQEMAKLKGYGLQNDLTAESITTRKQDNVLGAEELTESAKQLRQQKRGFESSSLMRQDKMEKIQLANAERNQQLEDLKRINNVTEQQQKRQKLTDMDAYETIQRLRMGNKLAALSMFNGRDSNGISDAVDLRFNDVGDLVIQRKSGEVLVYPIREINAIESRIQAEIAKNRKAPETIKTNEPILDKDGNPIVDPVTGKAVTREVPAQYDPVSNSYKRIVLERSGNDISELPDAETIQGLISGDVPIEDFERAFGLGSAQQYLPSPTKPGLGLSSAKMPAVPEPKISTTTTQNRGLTPLEQISTLR